MVAKTIMVQGTTSNAGKSMLAAALCQVFAANGLRTVPFKAWNMSRHSYITQTGLQIGLSQGKQAELLGLEPQGIMNPIYLKPCSTGKTDVFVRGKIREDKISGSFKDFAWPIIQESLQELRDRFDVVVLEGAGSPVELNIKAHEVANMRVAKIAKTPVLLVADVDCGGALAGLIGTFDLLEPIEKNLVIGSVLNKFRGDLDILKPGCEVITEHTGLPVVGVIPYCTDGDLLGKRIAEFLDLKYIYGQMGLVE